MTPALKDSLRRLLHEELGPTRCEPVLAAIAELWRSLGYPARISTEPTELFALVSLVAGAIEAERILAGRPATPWPTRRKSVELRLVGGSSRSG